jgi:glycylpeptide N-tetradecanoyltransferase
VLNHPRHDEINAAYSFYYFYPMSNAYLENNRRMVDLYHDALFFAAQVTIQPFVSLPVPVF